MIKVLVVGNPSILLQGVKQVLAESVDIVPVLEARMGLEVLDKVDVHALVDAVILVQDHDAVIAPMLDGVHLVRPDLPVLLVGAPEGGRLCEGPYLAMPRNTAPEQLVAEIRRLVRSVTGDEQGRCPALSAAGSGSSDERRAVHAED